MLPLLVSRLRLRDAPHLELIADESYDLGSIELEQVVTPERLYRGLCPRTAAIARPILRGSAEFVARSFWRKGILHRSADHFSFLPTLPEKLADDVFDRVGSLVIPAGPK